MNKIKEFIMKDFTWKILSLAIAICLWFIVINIENPMESRTFGGITVSFINNDKLLDQGLVVTNQEDFTNLKVSVKVRGQRISLDRLSQNKSKIEASVDLSKILTSSSQTDKIAIPIEVSLPSYAGDSFEIISRDPQYVHMSIDSVVSVEKPIEVDILGSAQNGFVAAQPQVSPSALFVSGAKSDVSKVSSVKVQISIEDAEDNIELKAQPKAYDSMGNPIDTVRLSVEEATIYVGIEKTKKIPVKVTTQGLPMEGYSLKNITWSPESITIVGKQEDIANISELTLPVVNVQNKTQDMQETYYINTLLPKGVRLYYSSQNAVTVQVGIEKEVEQRFEIQSNQITLEGSLSENKKATFRPENTAVTLRGTEGALAEIDSAKLEGKVSISALEEGTHQVPIMFDLPEGILVVDPAPTAEVIITSQQSEENTPSEQTPNEENTQNTTLPQTSGQVDQVLDQPSQLQ